MRFLVLITALAALCASAFGAEFATSAELEQRNETAGGGCAWPRGGRRCCGTLRSPGASHGWRQDETDHCFPRSASDHMVCCVDIQNVDNEVNEDDPTVAHHNPLSGPIRRNSDPSSYSWCTCSASICEKQLRGRVAWIGRPGDT
ncbi:hypothetical protein GPECTOR_43g952 [Gonium pectorale]|uniref:Uncharacterized protein n=1 Tax=Gonium pectorale TaxID=33097 RepID=A0A150GAC0_GONPE|nr:hypothetical protein GPECTOR_43g952 [Gonium pectorale]|eukprot:KXZ46515.1 hypothetical protein GPECTOR_43g952 [Gonium pectorale]